MTLKFREDKDLVVLALASHDDLERLAAILTHDKSDGQKRRSQELLRDPAFIRASKARNLRAAWKPIAAELQAFGGDSLANLTRSIFTAHKGVLYREIVVDIGSHLKLKIKPTDDIKELEDQLLVELIRRQKEKLSDDGLKVILKEAAKDVGLMEKEDQEWSFDKLSRRISIDAETSYLAAIVALAIAAVVSSPYQARLSLPVVAAAVARRAGGAFAPGLNLLSAAWTVKQLSSEAYRVTLPAVLEVIRIRRLALLSPRFGEFKA